MAGILKVDRIQSDSNLAFNIAGSNVAFMNATSLQIAGSNVSLAGTNVFTSGKLVTSAQPTGAVLQVVQGTYSTQTTSTSSTWVTSNLTASITPSSSSSKVFVSVSAPVGNFSPTNVAYLTIYRNSTSLADGGMQIIYTQSGGYTVWPVTMQILDSPSTTSSTSYTAYMNGADIRFCQNGLPAYITLMEIAA